MALKALQNSSCSSDYVSIFKLAKLAFIFAFTCSFFTFLCSNNIQQQSRQKSIHVSRIVFLKSHKCASTTIQNILLRYAFKHDLTVAFPKSGNFLGSPSHAFHVESDVSDTPWYLAGVNPDLFCLHSRWNELEVKKLMNVKGQPKPVFLSILRDPVEVLISSWDYYNFGQHLGFDDLEQFALSPEKPDHFLDSVGVNLRNSLLFDFGMSPMDALNETLVNLKITEIERTFNVILIAEYFPESVILLKEFLHWPYQDLVYLEQNQQSTKSQLSKVAEKNLKAWLRSDYKLYNHFLAKFKKKRQSWGKGLKTLELINRKVLSQCDVVLKPAENGKFWYQYSGNDTNCLLLSLGEMELIHHLNKVQGQRFNKTI